VLLALLPATTSGMGMPSQSSADADTWSRLAGGGVSARPFVESLYIITDPPTPPLWSGATSGATSPPAGYEASASGVVTAAVSAINMCGAGQTAAQGVCYASPNRVGVTLALTDGGALNTDLSGALSAASVLDVVLNLGSLSGRANWAWANANVSYWSVSSAVSGATRIHARLTPVRTPTIDWASLPPGPQCCTCDMPSNCAVANSSGWTLAANFIVQIDDVGATPGPMAGAVFATTNAVMGALALRTAGGNGGGAETPSLSYALASAHTNPDGAPMLGSLAALLPSAALSALFGAGTPAGALAVAREGDAGTQSSIRFANVSAADFGTDGVMVTVAGVTFSVPTYTITRADGGGGSSSSGAWRRGGGGAVAVAGCVAAAALLAAAV
jgi:hypothetical protein